LFVTIPSSGPRKGIKGKAVKIGCGPAAVTGDKSCKTTEDSATKTWEGQEEIDPGARRPACEIKKRKIFFYSSIEVFGITSGASLAIFS